MKTKLYYDYYYSCYYEKGAPQTGVLKYNWISLWQVSCISCGVIFQSDIQASFLRLTELFSKVISKGSFLHLMVLFSKVIFIEFLASFFCYFQKWYTTIFILLFVPYLNSRLNCRWIVWTHEYFFLIRWDEEYFFRKFIQKFNKTEKSKQLYEFQLFWHTLSPL